MINMIHHKRRYDKEEEESVTVLAEEMDKTNEEVNRLQSTVAVLQEEVRQIRGILRNFQSLASGNYYGN